MQIYSKHLPKIHWLSSKGAEWWQNGAKEDTGDQGIYGPWNTEFWSKIAKMATQMIIFL